MENIGLCILEAQHTSYRISTEIYTQMHHSKNVERQR